MPVPIQLSAGESGAHQNYPLPNKSGERVLSIDVTSGSTDPMQNLKWKTRNKNTDFYILLSKFYLRAHSHSVQLTSAVPKHDSRLSPLPCWPALTLLWAQLCLSMVTTCNYVITLRAHDYNFTRFVVQPFCLATPHSHLQTSRICSAETIGEEGDIQLYSHVRVNI